MTVTSLWQDRWPDVAHHVLDNGQTCRETLDAAPPAELAEVRHALPCAECPQNTACLVAKRKELGSLLYDREMMTRPRTGESSLFPYELFEPCLDPTASLVPHWRKPFADEHNWGMAQAWDIAWSERTGGDWLVCMSAALDRRTGQRHLLDICRWRGVAFDAQVRLVEEMWQLYPADLVAIEGDFVQQVWARHINRQTAAPVMAHSAGKKTDLHAGVPGLIITLEAGTWTIPHHPSTRHRDHLEAFLTEAEAFGWNDGKLEGVGEHDDTVMCFWHLNWALDRLAAPGPTRRRMGVQPAKID